MATREADKRFAHTFMHAPRPTSLLAGAYAGPSRRLQPRNALRWAVTIHIAGSPERQGSTVDLSPEGLSLATDRPISPGTRCLLRIQPPQGAAVLELAVKAVYSSYSGPGDFRIGLVFLSQDPQGPERLRTLVANAQT